jgi:hypothetical protein
MLVLYHPRHVMVGGGSFEFQLLTFLYKCIHLGMNIALQVLWCIASYIVHPQIRCWLRLAGWFSLSKFKDNILKAMTASISFYFTSH